MKRTILTLLSAVALSLCGSAAENPNVAADNSGKNVRDRYQKTLTPGDQSEAQQDRKMTQMIRRAIMKEKSLSMTAKNVKIVTANGRVTLRGPVKTAEEKKKINALAQAAAGQTPVADQLEIKTVR